MKGGNTMIGFLGIGLSTFAILATLLLVPVIYREIALMESEIMDEMEDFKNKANIIWKDVMDLQAGESLRASHGKTKRQSPIGTYYVPNYKEVIAPPQAQCQCSIQGQNQCPPGPPGPPGVSGMDGSRGLDGKEGKSGKAGAMKVDASTGCLVCPAGRGPPGLPGQRGIPGPKGITPVELLTAPQVGPPGPHGPIGDPGTPGGVGNEGFEGEAGANAYSIGGLPGLKGKPGVQGPPGDMGPGGETIIPVGPEGPRGELGLPGIPGVPGPDGQEGPLGDSGEPGNDAAYCPCPNRTAFYTNRALQRRNWFSRRLHRGF